MQLSQESGRQGLLWVTHGVVEGGIWHICVPGGSNLGAETMGRTSGKASAFATVSICGSTQLLDVRMRQSYKSIH